MTIYDWTLPRPTDGGTWPDNPSASGGPAQGGGEQNVFNMNMRLRARWTIPIRNTAELLAARQFQARMKGKSNLVRMPLFDGKRVSWPTLWGIKQTPRITRRPILDGTVYAGEALPDASDVYGLVEDSASLHATEIHIDIGASNGQGGPPLPGQWFSLNVAGEARAYLIEEVAQGSGGADNYSLTFIPPLRSAADVGDRIEFAKLYCCMTQTRSDMGPQVIDGLRLTALDMEFVEGWPDATESGT